MPHSPRGPSPGFPNHWKHHPGLTTQCRCFYTIKLTSTTSLQPTGIQNHIGKMYIKRLKIDIIFLSFRKKTTIIKTTLIKRVGWNYNHPPQHEAIADYCPTMRRHAKHERVNKTGRVSNTSKVIVYLWVWSLPWHMSKGQRTIFRSQFSAFRHGFKLRPSDCHQMPYPGDHLIIQ